MEKKLPKCKCCKERFTPFNNNSLQPFCMKKEACIKAAIDLNNSKQKKKQSKEWRAEKKAIKQKHKTWSGYVKDVETVFNAFIRERDKSMPCISCDALAGTYKLTAGHFWPTTYQYLRFNEDNVHSQCWFNCNKNKHGNVNEYRIRLIVKVGQKRVDELDNNRHKKLDLSIPELIELKEHYKQKLKDLKC